MESYELREKRKERELLDACREYWHARKMYYESLVYVEGSIDKAKERMYKAMESIWGPIDSLDFLIILEREKLKAEKNK